MSQFGEHTICIYIYILRTSKQPKIKESPNQCLHESDVGSRSPLGSRSRKRFTLAEAQAMIYSETWCNRWFSNQRQIYPNIQIVQSDLLWNLMDSYWNTKNDQHLWLPDSARWFYRLVMWSKSCTKDQQMACIHGMMADMGKPWEAIHMGMLGKKSTWCNIYIYI